MQKGGLFTSSKGGSLNFFKNYLILYYLCSLWKRERRRRKILLRKLVLYVRKLVAITHKVNVPNQYIDRYVHTLIIIMYSAKDGTVKENSCEKPTIYVSDSDMIFLRK